MQIRPPNSSPGSFRRTSPRLKIRHETSSSFSSSSSSSSSWGAKLRFTIISLLLLGVTIWVAVSTIHLSSSHLDDDDGKNINKNNSNDNKSSSNTASKSSSSSSSSLDKTSAITTGTTTTSMSSSSSNAGGQGGNDDTTNSNSNLKRFKKDDPLRPLSDLSSLFPSSSSSPPPVVKSSNGIDIESTTFKRKNNNLNNVKIYFVKMESSTLLEESSGGGDHQHKEVYQNEDSNGDGVIDRANNPMRYIRFRCIVVITKDSSNNKPSSSFSSSTMDDYYLSYYDWVHNVGSIHPGTPVYENTTRVYDTDTLGGVGSDMGVKIMDALSQTLRMNVPYRAYRFETPPVTSETLSTTPFEFVVVEDVYLAQFAAKSNWHPFVKQMQRCNNDRTQPGCIFDNLQGDATLIIPRDQGTKKHHTEGHYGHLANFMNNAPEFQIVGLWGTVARTLLDKLSTAATIPTWLSTAGTGVAWLHFRLDERPKYYTYAPYRIFHGNDDSNDGNN